MKERKISAKARIITGEYDPAFAERVAEHLDLPLEQGLVTHFANTELKAEVPAVRGNHVFVIQSHGAPVNQRLMEHVALINAAKRASAGNITAVVPYRGYGRADRPDNSHESYMGPIAMRMLVMAGADRIVEIDPHSGQSAGFLPDFNVEYTTVPAYPAIDEYLRSTIYPAGDNENYIMVAPDSGRAKTNRHYAERHKMGRAIVDKLRTGANQVELSDVVGNVEGLHCIMIDDMFDTAGTIIQGAEALRDRGASDVSIIATHGVLSGPAIERILSAKERGVIGHIAVTDTLKLPEHTPNGLIDIISVAPLLADALGNIFNDRSVSGMKAFH